METQALKVEVNSRVWYQDPPSKGCLSKVEIVLSRDVEEFLIDESNGSVSSLGSYPSSSPPDPLISLELRNFRPSYVYQRLHKQLHDPLLSRLLSNQIRDQAQGRDLSQRSLFMIIVVQLTHKEYMVVPSVPTATTGSDQESCAICLEDMSSESETKPICQLPNCAHLFHEQCLTKWLGRQQNSCPLCRQDVDNLEEV